MIYTQNEHFEPKVMEVDGLDEFPFQTQAIFRFQPGSFPFTLTQFATSRTDRLTAKMVV